MKSIPEEDECVSEALHPLPNANIHAELHVAHCGKRFLAAMHVASFPGRGGGEKTAWYPLLAHARAFPEKPGNSFSFVNGQ